VATNSQLSGLNDQILGLLATGMRTVVAPVGDAYQSVSEAQGGNGMNYTLGADTPLATDFSFVYRENNFDFGPRINEQVVKVAVVNESLGSVYSENSVVDVQSGGVSQQYALSLLAVNPKDAPSISTELRDDHIDNSGSTSDVLTHDIEVGGTSLFESLGLISDNPTQTDLGSLLDGPNGILSGISSAADPVTSALTTLIPTA